MNNLHNNGLEDISVQDATDLHTRVIYDSRTTELSIRIRCYVLSGFDLDNLDIGEWYS